MKMILIIFVSSILNAILAINNQPWPLKVEHIGKCCDIVTSSNISIQNLQSCITESTRKSFLKHSDVSILSFAIAGANNMKFSVPDIMDFAIIQRAIIAAYAETKQYLYRAISLIEEANLKSEFQTSDYRWFKIKFLIDALDPLSGWAKSTNYIVWIDADAIILDFSLNITNIGNMYPLADIIASADIRMGLINTGFLIMRNTNWLRQFLHEWYYDIVDKNLVCDQDAFDLLYSRYLQREKDERIPSNKSERRQYSVESITNKVKVLSMNALNSHPPAMLYQSEHDPILHLMGEITSMRSTVFLKAFQTICAARSGGILPSQLGLKRDVLLAHAQTIYRNEVQVQFIRANVSIDINNISSYLSTTTTNNDNNNNKSSSSVIISNNLAGNLSQYEELFLSPIIELTKSAHHYCDILNHIYKYHQAIQSDRDLIQQERQKLRYAILQLVLDRVTQVRQYLTNLDTDIQQITTKTKSILHIHSAEMLVLQSESNILSMQRDILVNILLQLLKLAAEAGNDLYGVSLLFQDKLNTAQLVFDILDELFYRVEDISKVVPLHMKALMHQNLGILHYETATALTKEHTTTATSTLPVNKITTEEFSTAHMYESYQQLKTSVRIFEQHYFEDIMDSSTLMEISYSLQLLAGVACSMNKYVEGTKIWESGIAQARSSLHGIKQGIRYDNLAVVLYNAALCYNDSHKPDIATSLASEAISILHDSINASSTGGFDDLHHSLLSTITKFSDKLKAKDDITSVMRAIDTPHGKIYIPLNKAVDTTSTEHLSDNDQWEECGLDEDCESFYVYEDEVDDEIELTSSTISTSSTGKTTTTPTIGSSSSSYACLDMIDDVSDNLLEGLDVSGMSDEDVLDLKEIRLRYYYQFCTSSSTITDAAYHQDNHNDAILNNVPAYSNSCCSKDDRIPTTTCIQCKTDYDIHGKMKTRLVALEHTIHNLLEEIHILQIDYNNILLDSSSNCNCS